MAQTVVEGPVRHSVGSICTLMLGAVTLLACGGNGESAGGHGGDGGSGGLGGRVDTFACTEQGIRDAIDAGGGPHTFDCAAPTTVVTEAEIVIDNDVILDGEGNLTVDGNESHRVFSIPEGIEAELRGFVVTKGFNAIYGGGIWSAGTLTLVSSVVSQSSVSRGDAGGIYNTGSLTLLDSTVSGNAGGGGAIRNEGALTLVNSTVSQNQKLGISNTGTLELTNSEVSANIGGGILSWESATLTDSAVVANVGGGIGSIGTLTLTRTVVSGNADTIGGGIYNQGIASVTDSTISDNTASLGGGAGIFNGGTLTLTRSTVSGNTTTDGYGGGISNEGALTLLNSTVSGNSAIEGGAIWSRGTVALIHATISGSAGGGIAVYDQETCFPECALPAIELARSVVDGKCTLCTASEGIVTCEPLTDRGAAVESAGYNIESPGNTCGLDQPTDEAEVSANDLQLGPLQDNGGSTRTHALLVGSMAIDTIPEADCVDTNAAPLTIDQRGEPRPDPGGSRCDTGAFEAQP